MLPWLSVEPGFQDFRISGFQDFSLSLKCGLGRLWHQPSKGLSADPSWGLLVLNWWERALNWGIRLPNAGDGAPGNLEDAAQTPRISFRIPQTPNQACVGSCPFLGVTGQSFPSALGMFPSAQHRPPALP